MLDLETMGTAPNSAIIAIGAVKFNEKEITDRFYEIVDISSCIKAGLVIDGDTVLWWLKQSKEARSEYEKKGKQLVVALEQFTKWMGKNPIIWGCGSDFDNVILSSAYQAVSMEVPWKFWNNRCYRTMKSMYTNVKAPVRKGTYHCAVDDSEYQANHLIEILKHMNKEK